MKSTTTFLFLFTLWLFAGTQGYFLIPMENTLTTQRLDPLVTPGKIATHVHTVLGGSNFGLSTNTSHLRASKCTSNVIKEDMSNYWFPTLYFQFKNGSFASVGGNAVLYYLFDTSAAAPDVTAFPDDFRMVSGDPTLRSYDSSSHAQQAITFLCLDFNGQTTRHNSFPPGKCKDGIRAQINFPSCWDGKNVDSDDHKSHVAFQADGPDQGGCKDPKFPVTIPRLFLEYYTDTATWDTRRDEALNPSQPYVYATGDPTGYSYHADFINGWQPGVLQKVVNKQGGCDCNDFGDPTCCVQRGLFEIKDKTANEQCFVSDTVDEQVLGVIPKLPGNNPVTNSSEEAKAKPTSEGAEPSILSPVYVYDGTSAPPGVGKPVTSTGAPSGAGGDYGYGAGSGSGSGSGSESGAYVGSASASAPASSSTASSKQCKRAKRSFQLRSPPQVQSQGRVVKKNLKAHRQRNRLSAKSF